MRFKGMSTNSARRNHGLLRSPDTRLPLLVRSNPRGLFSRGTVSPDVFEGVDPGDRIASDD
jgi:hypothetical protein